MDLTSTKFSIGNVFHRDPKTTHGMWDLKIINEVVVQDCYGLSNCWPIGGLVLDVGAHIGSFGLMVKHFHEAASVVCFEPLFDNFNVLSKNVAGLDDVKAHNLAVIGTMEKSVGFMPHDENTGGGTVSRKSQYKVGATCLSCHMRDKEVDLLKMDCEGAEESILAELGSGVIRVKRMVGEWHGIGMAEKLRSMLAASHDFKITSQMLPELGTFEAVRRKA